MIIVSPQYGSITFSKINSDTISSPNLPGSETFYCNEQFGTILLQEYKNEFYSIRFGIFNIIKKISFWITEDFFLRTTFSLNNNIKIKTRKSASLELKKGQYVFYSGNTESILMQFEKLEDCRVFESSFSEKLLSNFIEAFPSLKEYIDDSLNSSVKRRIESVRFTSPETKKIINDILSCPYDHTLRKMYFENKVNDLLFELLATTFKKESEFPQENQSETEAIFKARQIVIEDITKHYSIKELAGLVNLNQLKLKKGFKQTFGTGIFEYLLNARMEKAYELILETGKPIKEIASETGFEYVANFITAFRKHFGQTPGDLRRK